MSKVRYHDVLTLREVLKRFRSERGLTCRALSQKAGLSASYIGKLESGDLDPSVKAFALIALALELTSTEVLFCVQCALAESRTRLDAGEFLRIKDGDPFSEMLDG